MHVYVLGLGSIGTFAAHALAEVPKKPVVTLLLHRQSLMEGYARNGNKLLLETNDGDRIAHEKYEFEALHKGKWHRMDAAMFRAGRELSANIQLPTSTLIEHLIVCVKSTQTVAALRPLVPRLSSNSTIMFLQNGAGMIEDVNQQLWRDPETRPSYITGVISHGITLKSAFEIAHTGFAATSIGLVPRCGLTRSNAETASYLLEALPLVPRFNCRSYKWPDIFQIQLEKLATNAFCNPLCALSDSPNSYLFTVPEICRALMREISSVVLALPELKDTVGVAERFSAQRLESTVMGIIGQTRNTVCSMVWDLRAGRQTEIDYINGYWARRGRDVGVPTPINDELVDRIKERTATTARDIRASTS